MTKFNYNNCSKCGKISGVSVKGNKTTMEEVKDEVKRLEGINNWCLGDCQQRERERRWLKEFPIRNNLFPLSN